MEMLDDRGVGCMASAGLSLYTLSIFYASRHTSLASSKSRRVSSMMRDVHRKASEKSIPSAWSNRWSKYAFDGNTVYIGSYQITSPFFHCYLCPTVYACNLTVHITPCCCQ